MWVEMAVSCGNCSVLCRIYERGKEVERFSHFLFWRQCWSGPLQLDFFVWFVYKWWWFFSTKNVFSSGQEQNSLGSSRTVSIEIQDRRCVWMYCMDARLTAWKCHQGECTLWMRMYVETICIISPDVLTYTHHLIFFNSPSLQPSASRHLVQVVSTRLPNFPGSTLHCWQYAAL